jgi:hypothetical protein
MEVFLFMVNNLPLLLFLILLSYLVFYCKNFIILKLFQCEMFYLYISLSIVHLYVNNNNKSVAQLVYIFLKNLSCMFRLLI